MKPDVVEAIIAATRAAWSFSNDIEITLEANPTSVEAEKFEAFREAGVNRVSVGIQALNDTDLKRLGRLHSVAEAKAAYDIARQTFDRVSFDLIYARQDQTPEAWRQELTEALAMGADHISLYQLTIEPGTAFGDRFDKGMLRGLPEENASADMYDITQDMCDAAGLPAYEVSNHARPGAESQHNLIYWRGGDWAGIGPGAHGRLTVAGARLGTETELSPLGWLTKVERDGSGETQRSPIAREEWAEEYLMMGLRLADGVSLSRLGRLSMSGFNREKADELKSLGMLEESGDVLRATKAGRPVLNAVLRELLV